MSSIKFYAPAGVQKATLSNGVTLPVVNGYVTADANFAGELLRAGFTPATEDSPRPRLRGPKKWAILGDSIAAQNIEANAGSCVYRGKGYLTWAMSRLGWPADIQFSDNYAVSGSTMDVMVATQLPALVAGHVVNDYERCFISSGTNDFNAGVSLATAIYNAERLIGGVAAAGIIPVHIGVLPRAISGGMTNAKRQGLRFNDWLANYAAKTGALEYIPCHEAVANNADANGYILAAASQDALHPNDWGAYFIGEAIYNYYAGMGLPSALQFAQSQADQYEATYNQSGVVFDTPNPLLLGGTTAPTGMSSAGSNITWAVGTRNLNNGQTRATVAGTIIGATGGYLYDDNVASGAWGGAGEEIGEGDVVYAQALVEVTTGAAGVLPHLELSENDGVTAVQAKCLSRDQVDCPAIPNGTILTLRTPNLTVRPYAGSGSASLFAKLNAYSGGNSGVLTVRAFEMRKAIL